MKALHLLLAVALSAAFPALADVAVVDSVSVNSREKAEQESAGQAQAKANAELYYQLQLLQDEVMRLQGKLEEQQHELKQLKQQGMDNYINLDKRLSAIEQGGNRAGASPAPAPTASASTSTVSTVSGGSASSSQGGDYQAAYQKAYDLIPKRQFDRARTAFEAFLKDYPGTPYQANAYYWLGELYLIDGDKTKAKNAFKTILSDYPDHNKYPEALYKMAVINFEQGDKMTAKQQLQTLIDNYGNTANATVIEKARGFLQKNFP